MSISLSKFEVLTKVAMRSSIFWDITTCSVLVVNPHFGGKYRLHLQGQINQARNQHEGSNKSSEHRTLYLLKILFISILSHWTSTTTVLNSGDPGFKPWSGNRISRFNYFHLPFQFLTVNSEIALEISLIPLPSTSFPIHYPLLSYHSPLCTLRYS
jgi:hypothetical protein